MKVLLSRRLLGVALIFLAGLVVLAAWGIYAASGWHAHVGNQGQRFRVPWLEGVTHYATRGPNDCSATPCHGAGAVDFALGYQERVKAIGDGQVYRSTFDACGGNFVEVSHTIGPNTYKSRYLHLYSRAVSANEQVQQGRIVGLADNTGSCTSGTHLHFDIWQGSSSVAWPDQISQTDAGMWSTAGHTAVSNNPGAGYWGESPPRSGKGGTNESPEYRERYLARGWVQLPWFRFAHVVYL